MTFSNYNHDAIVNQQYKAAKKYNNEIKQLVELNKQRESFSCNNFQDRRCRNYLEQKIKKIRKSK
jgi:hypothetical protein